MSINLHSGWTCKPLCALGGGWVVSVHLQSNFKAAWAVCGRKPATGEKYSRAITPPTTDGVFPLHQIGGNISTRRRITRKSVDCREQREETPARTEGQICTTLRRLTRDERGSRIKNRRQEWRSVRSLLPAVRAVTGVFGAFQSGVKIAGVISLLRSPSPRAYSRKKKVGVMAWKRCYREQKGIFRSGVRQSGRCPFCSK